MTTGAAASEQDTSEPQRLDEVLDVAATLFHVQGYSATSLTDIGNQLGIHKASLYHYVTSKQDLLRRVVFRASVHLRRLAADPDLFALDARVALEHLVRGHCKVLFAHPHEFGVLIDQRRHMEPDVIADIGERERSYVATLRQIIDRGVQDGTLHPVDPGVATQLVLDVANGVLRWYRPDGRRTEEQVIDDVWAFVERGLIRDPKK